MTTKPRLGRPPQHGHRHGGGTQTYRAWVQMKRACTYPKSPMWRFVGARGISYHPEWDDFAPFLRDVGPAPEGHTLRRVDPTQDYLPGNVAWRPRARREE